MRTCANYSALPFKHRKRLPGMRLTSNRRQSTEMHFVPETAVVQRRAGCVCGGGCPYCLSLAPIQTKLRIGHPNDKYEQEADRVADQVMNMPRGQIRRQVEEEEEENETLQTKLKSDLIPGQADVEAKKAEMQTKTTDSRCRYAPADLSAGVQALRGGGRRLPKSMRLFFESRLGQNFDQVRVHTDSRAADITRAVNARAFTWRKDIVFAQGQYAPDTREGRRLLAHELTHVAQQAGSDVVHRTPDATLISAQEKQQLLRAIQAKIAQINGALTRGYAWSAETYRNGIIEIGLFGMRFPVAHRNLYLLRLRRYLEELRSRVRADNVPDPTTHPTGAHHYVTRPFELQWLVSHYLEELGIRDPAFDMYISYTEFSPITTAVLPRVSGVVRPLNLGRYIVVADPVHRPTDVEPLDPYRRQSGVILDLWQEAGVYFYYYRGQKHYLPDFRLY